MAIRDAGRRGKQATVTAGHHVTDTVARYAKRMVCNHEPEEDEPKPPRAKPIVSINGKDVDRKDDRSAA